MDNKVSECGAFMLQLVRICDLYQMELMNVNSMCLSVGYMVQRLSDLIYRSCDDMQQNTTDMWYDMIYLYYDYTWYTVITYQL